MGAQQKINPNYADLPGLCEWASSYVDSCVKSVVNLPIFALQDINKPCKLCLGASKRAARLQVYAHGERRDNSTLAAYIDFEIACPDCNGTGFDTGSGARLAGGRLIRD